MGDGLSITEDQKTGRSHRMIAEALAKVREGKTVHVIALYHIGEEKLTKLAVDAGATPEELAKMIIIKCKAIWDLETLLSHNSRDFIYFVDHAVLENQYCNVLAMLHRYDKA